MRVESRSFESTHRRRFSHCDKVICRDDAESDAGYEGYASGVGFTIVSVNCFEHIRFACQVEIVGTGPQARGHHELGCPFVRPGAMRHHVDVA